MFPLLNTIAVKNTLLIAHVCLALAEEVNKLSTLTTCTYMHVGTKTQAMMYFDKVI